MTTGTYWLDWVRSTGGKRRLMDAGLVLVVLGQLFEVVDMLGRPFGPHSEAAIHHALIASPWLLVAWLGVRRHPLAPWMVLGVIGWWMGVSGWTVRWTPEPLRWAHHVAALLTLPAAFGDRLDSRWRVSGFLLGTLSMAASHGVRHGVIFTGHPSFGESFAPSAAVAVAFFVVGAVGLLRGRSWALGFFVLSAFVPAVWPLPSAGIFTCTGSTHHPWFLGGCGALWSWQVLCIPGIWASACYRHLRGGEDRMVSA